jgi:GTP-binding protein EngB required for normal cell division
MHLQDTSESRHTNVVIVVSDMTRNRLIGRSMGKSTLFRELTGQKVKVGRRPGITQYPHKVRVGNIFYVDMPGYGFMFKTTKEQQEKTKDLIVEYFESHANEIMLAVQVIDAASFLDIANRWEDRGEVPFEIELYGFLNDLGLDVVLAANKMDRIANKDEALDDSGTLRYFRPGQWRDKVLPQRQARQIEHLRSILNGI